ncbi:MAG: tetratricopeptide repeat protein, partial [Planctomycetaceae bacterium]|nr:tetratricopeptide repeat protein [Planctomycetaceae bacterium]
IREYRQAISLNPQQADAFFNLATLLETTAPAEAANHYRQALKINPGLLPAQTRLQQLLKQRPSETPD